MINEIIESKLSFIFKELNYNIDIKIIKSNREDLGDYQYDGLFKLASMLHKSPQEIGEEISKKWNEEYANIAISSFSFPGFINFKLTDELINESLNYMNSNPKYGLKIPKKETYVIDYGGPNIAKPLHVGHLRSAIVGESIKRIIKYMGHDVISDVHLGDLGLQIGEVIYGLIEEGKSIDEIDINTLERIYPYVSKLCKENEEIKEKCAQITKELQNKNPLYVKYYEKIKEVSIKDIKRIYDYLDVSFDYWYGESYSYKYITKTTKMLEDKKLLQNSEGAKVVDVRDENDTKELPPFIYQKSNGAYLYSTTDLATIIERLEDFKPDNILYVTDNRQALHFKSLFRVCEKLGIKTNFVHLPFGTVNGVDGKPFKTREGKAPKLDELFKETKEAFKKTNPKNENMSESDLDIIVNSILKFADLQNNREKDYIFDINKFSKVIGKTGPYILYTYLRLESILKQENINDTIMTEKTFNEYDRKLRIKLLELTNTLEEVYKDFLPSTMCNYLYDLCVLANSFYENNHINKLENEKLKNNWLILLQLVNNILKDMLNLLSIKIPNKM